MVKVRPPPQAHAERAERAEGAEHPCHSGAEERLAVAPLPIRPPLATQALRELQSAEDEFEIWLALIIGKTGKETDTRLF